MRSSPAPPAACTTTPASATSSSRVRCCSTTWTRRRCFRVTRSRCTVPIAFLATPRSPPLWSTPRAASSARRRPRAASPTTRTRSMPARCARSASPHPASAPASSSAATASCRALPSAPPCVNDCPTRSRSRWRARRSRRSATISAFPAPSCALSRIVLTLRPTSTSAVSSNRSRVDTASPSCDDSCAAGRPQEPRSTIVEGRSAVQRSGRLACRSAGAMTSLSNTAISACSSR